MTTVLLVGLASGVLSLALARGSLFDPIRRRLPGLAGELFGCYLCLGAYLSAVLWIVQPVPAGVSEWVAWAASWAVGVAWAAGVERLMERD